ncbi:MAG: STIMATE family protein [archaeon]|nr:STIMATE family protein [archaeon]
MKQIKYYYDVGISTIGRILDETEKTQKCELFNFFSYLVQLCLAILSFSVLVFKRYRERPMRPWKVWFFDISKQIASACTQHCLNLLLSVIASVETTADECIWYFLNFLLDTTIGILSCYLMMSLVQWIVKKYRIDILKTGFYFEKTIVDGQPRYRLKIKMYLAQLINWIIIIIINKFIMFGLNRLCKVPFEAVGNFLLKPFTFNDKLELIMVMIVFPVIFNIIQFWVFDEILKFNPEAGQTDVLINAMEDENEAQIKEQILKEGENKTEMVSIDSNKDETKLNENPSLNTSISSAGTSTDLNKSNNEITNKEDNKKDKLLSVDNAMSETPMDNSIENNTSQNISEVPQSEA